MTKFRYLIVLLLLLSIPTVAFPRKRASGWDNVAVTPSGVRFEHQRYSEDDFTRWTTPLSSGIVKLSNQLPVDVDLCISDKAEVEIFGPTDELDKIRIHKSGETLELTQKVTGDFSDVTIRVSMSNIRELNLYASGNIVCHDNLSSDVLDINLLGAGGIELKSVKGSKASLCLLGTGDISIDSIDVTSIRTLVLGIGSISLGYAEASTMSATISGPGNIEIGRLKVSAADIKIPGIGNVECPDIEANRLLLSVPGIGDIVVGGTANTAIVRVSGMGNVDTSRLKAKNLSTEGNIPED